MLLNFHCKCRRIPTYAKLARELRADKLPSDKCFGWYSDDYGMGAYVGDICLWLLQRRFAFAASNHKSRRNVRTVFDVLPDTPVMVGMDWFGVGHWVVMVDSDDEYVTILDPNRPSRGRVRDRISRSRFWSEWDGAAVAILGRPN